MKKIAVLFLFTFAGLLSGTALYWWKQIHRPAPNQVPVIVHIPKGASSQEVGNILQQAGLIRAAKHFRWYCRLTGKSNRLKAGFFQIPPHASLVEIADLLSWGRAAVKQVTIPEGRASWEIYSLLKVHYPKLDSQRWESLVHDRDFARELDLPTPHLEGWLFPDTYSLPYAADEAEILRILVETAKNAIDRIDTTKPGSRFRELGGWAQVITLASIIEEETGDPEERPLISGVFHNRLRQKIPLGADPTVRYIFRNLTGPIYKSQLASENPYNTRRFTGLPPGPISNPGRQAIEAALYPAETQALYFVAKDDGSGRHFFASTLKQHNAYKEQAAKNRATQSPPR